MTRTPLTARTPRDPFDPTPTPGGLRRFLISVTVAALLLTGVVAGLFYWIRATARSDYEGPPKLTYPENRPFR